ncbi:hypothetical protein Tco_1234884 [Tanacetum coccineum]
MYYMNEDFEGKRTIDALMGHVPVIVMSDDDSDLPSTQKRNVNNDENVITKDDVRLISSDYEELFPCTERKLSEEDTKKMKTWGWWLLLGGCVRRWEVMTIGSVRGGENGERRKSVVVGRWQWGLRQPSWFLR